MSDEGGQNQAGALQDYPCHAECHRQGHSIRGAHMHRVLHRGLCTDHDKVVVLATGAERLLCRRRFLTEKEAVKYCGEVILVLQSDKKRDHDTE